MTSVLVFIVVIGVLIFVHELGHFLAAKGLGVQVLRFSLGFGRPLVSWRRGETEYWISWLPIGGYVKMAGLEDEGLEKLEGVSGAVVDPARAFDQKPVWRRLVILGAGVTMNLVLALVIFVGIATVVGTPELAVTRVDSVAVAALPPEAKVLGALTHGDSLARVNGTAVRSWDTFLDAVLAGPPELMVEAAGRAPIHARLGDVTARRAVAGAVVPLIPARLGVVQPGFPAYSGGLRAGDLVVRAGGDTVRSWTDLLAAIRSHAGRPLPFVVRRGDETVAVTVVPESRLDTIAGKPVTIGFIGAFNDRPTRYTRVSLGEGVRFGVVGTGRQIGAIASVFGQMLRGRFSLRDLGGPIMIGQLSGQAARLGFVDWLLPFVAIFSINLAILNLLPIPVLDGGQIAFVLAEAVRRKPLPLEVRLRLSQVGLFIILCLMLFAIGNDLVRNLFH